MLAKLLIGAIALYGLLLLLGTSVQRRLLYRIDPVHVTPQQAGLSGVEELQIDAPDGASVVAWYGKAKAGRPTLLYFHGNGGSLATRTPRIERFMAEGWGVFMMTYRGYGGSTGSPSERNNIADAVRAFDRLVGFGVSSSDIVLYGESLGSGVATAVAVQRRAAGLILDAPFTSIPDVAARTFWYLPVRLIMRDRYETSRIIDKIEMPLLILHGTKDATVPVEMGRDLARLAREPKTFAELPRAGHSDIYVESYGGLAVVRAFLAAGQR
jgi:uncharacterized protein